MDTAGYPTMEYNFIRSLVVNNKKKSDHIIDTWDCFREKGPNTHVFSFLYSRSLKCSPHIASYALRIGVSVIEL